MTDKRGLRFFAWGLLAALAVGCAGGRTATVYDRKGVALLADRNPSAAIVELEKGLSDPQVVADPAAKSKVLEMLGWAHGEAHQFAAAEKRLNQALAAAREAGLDPSVIQARLAVVRAKSGRFAEGVAAAEEALALTADRWRDKAGGGSTREVIDYAVANPGFPPDEDMIRAAVMSESALAVLYFTAGDMEKAAMWGERTVRHSEQLGFLMKMAPALDRINFYQGVGVAAGAASQAYARLGDPDKKKRLFDAGVRAFAAIGIPVAGDDLLGAYIASGRGKAARAGGPAAKTGEPALSKAPPAAKPAPDERFSEAYQQAERLYRQGKLDEAERAFGSVLDAALRQGQKDEAARAESQLGWLLAEKGRYAEGIRHLESSAIDASREDERVMSLVRLAAVLARLGRIEAAIDRAEEALQTAIAHRPALFKDTDREAAIDRFMKNPGLPPDVVMLKAVLGSEAAKTVALYFSGDYKEAARLGKKAVAHFRQAESAVSIAAPLDRRDYYEGIGYTALCTADALTFLDRTDEGRRVFAEAERYFEKSGTRFGIYAARALAACSYLREGRYEQGTRSLRQIWEDLQSLELDDILWRAKARFAYYFDLHAQERIGQIASIGLDPTGAALTADQIRFRDRFAAQAAGTLSSISLLLDAGAAAQVEEAIAGLRSAESQQAMDSAAKELVRRIRKAAWDNYREALDHVDSVRSRLETDLNKRAFRADKQLLYEGYIRLSVDLFGARAGLEAVERAKARELRDLLAGRQIAFKQRQMAEAERRSRRQAARRVAAAIAAGENRSAIEPALERYRAVLVELHRTEPELASLIGAESPGFEEIAAVVPRPGALLTYYAASDALYIFAARAGRAWVRRVPVSAQELARHVDTFREAIIHRREQVEKREAKRLYALLFQPVEDLLHEKRLVVVPDGPLHYLPFAALSDGAFRLSERFSLSFAPSAGVLAFAMAAPRPKERAVLAFGNPDLKNRALDLPGAQLEAVQVADLYPGSEALVGEKATETAARRHSPAFPILHFATHGEFSRADPLYSGLRLAADDRNDGRLEAAEIFSLDLHADVITLSACRTGLGRVNRGGEVIGLNRAFLYAGTPRILSSLWNVGDESTRLMMLDFYRNLQLMPADRALQEAQLRLMGSERFAAAYYWASFYLTGDWR